MREILLDIVKHTGDLGFLEVVKVTGTKDETLIETMDADKLVVVKGNIKDPVEDFIGEFGLNNLNLLKFYCNYPNFKGDKASITAKKETRNNVDLISEINFQSEDKDTTATYRVMNAQLVPNQQKFIKDKWDIVFTPSTAKINEFASLASGLSSIESYFMPKTNANGDLCFYIGDESAATNKANMVFEKGVKANFPAGLYWPIQHVLAVLKLALDNKAEPEVSLMEIGALQITFSSKHCDWKYIFPAKRK